MASSAEGTWESLPVKLHEGILETLRELRFTHMTPVQVSPARWRHFKLFGGKRSELALFPHRPRASRFS